MVASSVQEVGKLNQPITFGEAHEKKSENNLLFLSNHSAHFLYFAQTL